MSINAEMITSKFIQQNYLILRKNTLNLEDLCTFFVQNGILNFDEIERIKSPFLKATSSDKNEKFYEFLSKKEIPVELLKNALKTCGNSHLVLEIEGQSSNSISEPSDPAVSNFEGNMIEETIRNIPLQNESEIEIIQSEYALDGGNAETILTWAKDNYTVKKLKCEDISTSRVPQILKKFKSIQDLFFGHKMTCTEDCVYLDSISEGKREEVCLFKMVDLEGYPNLKILNFANIDVSFPGTIPNFPELRALYLEYCDISGDYINDFISVSNLEEVILWGNAPMLTKEDVEKLLRSKSLKLVSLGKHFREIFATSFRPIGSDGNQMEVIPLNANILFKRESFDKPWTQTTEFHEIANSSFNLTSENVEIILNSTTQNLSITWLTCSNISTRRFSDILKKFGVLSRLEFSQNMEGVFEAPKPSFFSSFLGRVFGRNEEKNPIFGQEDCLLKIIEMKGYESLDTLCLEGIVVEFPQGFSFSEYLPGLKFLGIIFCSVIGNLVDALVCGRTSMKVELQGITPSLTKGDVEALLKSSSLRVIILGKHNKREIFSSSFTPIGPDGVPMQEISQNATIYFLRNSIGPKLWTQTVEQMELTEFKLTNRNVETILNSPIQDKTVTKLDCLNISTKSVPAILKKFKSIEKLQFVHEYDYKYKICAYFSSRSNEEKEDLCLFKMDDLAGYTNLKILELEFMDVRFPQTLSNLRGLIVLSLIHCDITSDFINDFIYGSNLQGLILCGISPILSKEDVEKLLRSKSLVFIRIVKHLREIFDTSFTPIGPHGNIMKEITPNSNIEFTRESFDKPWDQKVEQNVDINLTL